MRLRNCSRWFTNNCASSPRHKMAQEAPGNTLQPTALVHEAWLRIAGSHHQHWNSRNHFFMAAAEAMRRILVDSSASKIAA